MRKFIVIMIAVLAITGAAAVVSAQEATPEATPSAGCSLPFEATVYQGTDAALALKGTLSLNVDDLGSASGVLETNDGSTYPVVGQINGRAINLAFDLGDNVYIFGLGTSFEPMDGGNCGKALGGPFVGPAPDDTGTWLAGSALKASTKSS